MNQETKACELKDCLTALGFSKKEIECYEEYQNSHNQVGLKQLLNQKRKEILDSMHVCYEKLECIDYLIGTIEK